MNHEIKLLPEHIINQIKAGEVVESPATLLKELIENSIDANANRIEINISEDLTSHIIIKDNGHGMTKKNLPLAFTRHATSKIYQFNDIYQLHSFGFRGEALASIASISDVSCRTTCENKTATMEISSGNIVFLEERESNEIQGTEFHIKNIFQHTPARLKFIRSKNSEKNKLKKIIEVFIISNPTITFIVNIGEKDKEFYPAIIEENAIQKRIIQLISSGKKKLKEDDLFTKDFSYQGHHITFIANKISTKGISSKRQYLVANNRYFIDKKIHHIIIKKMSETFWPLGQSGDYFCLIKVPPEMMDPNVHPSKTEIKFVFHEYLLSGLSSIIKNDTPQLQNIIQLTDKSSTLNENCERNFKIEDTYFYKLESQQQNGQIFNFFNQFLLTKENDDFFTIYHTEKIFKSFANYFFSNVENLCKNSSTLLIGIIFNSQEISNNSPELIQKYNLHLEKIKEDTWILKEIPEVLSFLPTNITRDILLILINDDSKNDFTISNLIEVHTKNLNVFNIRKMETIIETKDFSKRITPKHLKSIFEQSI